MDTLRVAIITDHAEPGERVDGGVQAVTRYLVDALVRRDDIDLHVISFRYGMQGHRTVQADGYTHYILAGSRLGTLTAFSRDQRCVNERLKGIRPHVVHGQGAGQNGILAARSGYPCVITIHGIMAEESRHLSGPVRRARHWLLSRISDRYCITRGQHTILITPYVAEYFGSRLSGQRHFIPNPIADSFFSIPRTEVEGRVLFAGRLYRLKGVLDLVKACGRIAEYRPLELHLAGSTADRDYVAMLEAAAGEHGIADRMKILGLLDERQLQRELAEAAVLALPSYQETAPMVVVEAMAAGVPVVASNVGGSRFLVEDGTTGYLVNPGDPELLTDRLDRLLEDSALRQRFGRAARSRAGEDYRAARIAERTVDVYRQAISDRAS